MMVSYASTKGIKYSSLQNCNIRENNSGINIVQIIIIIIDTFIFSNDISIIIVIEI